MGEGEVGGQPAVRHVRCRSGQGVRDSGGKLEVFYYAFGESDVVTVIDLPDNATAAGIALLIAASGKVRIKTTVLLSPEEVDAAVKGGGNYRPPGG